MGRKGGEFAMKMASLSLGIEMAALGWIWTTPLGWRLQGVGEGVG